ANNQSADPQGSRAAEGQVEGSCDGAEPAKARRLHPGLYDDPQEAELGVAQGGQGPPDQPARGDQLHPGRGPQPPGALGGADSGWPCARPSRCALPRAARRARYPGRQGPPSEPFQVRCQAAQV
ncbi:MAG: SSU ribosomal protein S12p (S23e), partial [uncultured Sphingomonas sp.]